MGEAYLRILNPEQAVIALETAYKLNPLINNKLRIKIGRTLITTHEYHKAIDFYENIIHELSNNNNNTIKNENNSIKKTNKTLNFKENENNNNNNNNNNPIINTELITLSHDLSKLYIKLEKYESAIRILKSIIHIENNNNNNNKLLNINEMKDNILTNLLLIDIYIKQQTINSNTNTQTNTNVQSPTKNTQNVQTNQSNKDIIIKTLNINKNLQSIIINELRKLGNKLTNEIINEKIIYSNICVKIGEIYYKDLDYKLAMSLYLEGLSYYEANTNAMLGSFQLSD